MLGAVTLNVDDNFERLNVNGDDFLIRSDEKSSERRIEKWWWWLWTPKPKSDEGSWKPKLKNDDGSERQTENSDGSERQNWEAMMALNAKTENDDGSEHRIEKWWLGTQNENAVMALNAKTGNATLKVKLRSKNGSERRNWETPKLRNDNDGAERRNRECDSERQTKE